jgi:AcrR family transcriptional regulator
LAYWRTGAFAKKDFRQLRAQFSVANHNSTSLWVDKDIGTPVTYQPFSMSDARAKTQQSAETREGIVMAALKLFAKHGFASASIAEIAEAAGITKGAIYWHFDSKDALFKAILDQIRHVWQNLIRNPLEAESDPLLKIELLFDQYALFLKREPEVCLFLQRVLLEPEGEYAKQVARVFDRTQIFVARILEDAKRAGKFDSQLDSAVVARTILISLTGVTAHCHANRSLSVEAVVTELKQQIISRAKHSSGEGG